MKLVSSLSLKFILILASILLLITSSINILITSKINQLSERVIFSQQNIEFFIILIIIVTLLILLKSLIKRLNYKFIFISFFLLCLITGIILIINSSPIMRADAFSVYNAARQINHRDFSPLRPDAYIGIYPHQLGLMTFYRIILFFSQSTKLLFIMNLISYLLIQFILLKIMILEFGKNSLKLKYSIILSYLFLPLFIYILFPYNSIIGLLFLIISMFFWQQYFNFFKNVDAIFAILFLIISCTIRNNFQIAVIAIIIILFLNILNSKKFKNIIFILLMIFGLFFSNKSIINYYEKVSGYSLNSEVAMSSYIVMGLQDEVSKDSPLGGWYSGITLNIMSQNDHNKEKESEESYKLIKKRIHFFINNPKNAFHFFLKKYSSTWAEPSFQSFWSGPHISMNQYGNKGITKYIFDNNAFNQELITFMNVINFLIYLFSGICAMFLLKNNNRSKYLFINFAYIYYIGGVLFHLLWETKSQYVFPYVFCLIPSAVLGIAFIKNKLIKIKSDDNI